LILYNALDGSIISVIEANPSFSDTLVTRNDPIYNFDNKKWDYILKLKNDVVLNYWERRFKKIDNKFINASFSSYDNINASSQVWYYIVDRDEINPTFLLVSNCVGIKLNNDLEIKNIIKMENNKHSYSSKILANRDNFFYVCTAGENKDSNGNTVIVSKHDKDGNFIEKLIYYPNYYKTIKNEFFKKDPILNFAKNFTIYVFPFENKIRFLGNEKIINLKNIEFDNLEHYSKLNEFLDTKPNLFQIVEYFPVRIKNIYSFENDLYVFLSIRTENKKYYQLMQKYDIKSGKLLNSKKVTEVIKHQTFTMSKDCKYIYSVHLEDENYIVKKTEVNSLWEK